MYDDCFSKRKDRLGEDHPDTLAAMHNLASVFDDTEEYKKAQSLYESCLEKKRDALGNNHPSTLQSMNNLAVLYDKTGQDDRAQSLYDECLERQKTVLGDRNPVTLRTMHNLASQLGFLFVNKRPTKIFVSTRDMLGGKEGYIWRDPQVDTGNCCKSCCFI